MYRSTRVTAKNNQVWLDGSVASVAEEQHALAPAKTITWIRDVVDNITVTRANGGKGRRTR
jgi:osmotically-inducible protein OsmY